MDFIAVYLLKEKNQKDRVKRATKQQLEVKNSEPLCRLCVVFGLSRFFLRRCIGILSCEDCQKFAFLFGALRCESFCHVAESFNFST